MLLSKYSTKPKSIFIALAIIIPCIFALVYKTKLQKAIQIMDISTQSSVICQKRNPTWLISYADGNDVYFANQRTLTASGLNKCIDYFKNYNKNLIDPDYLNKHKNIFNQTRGAGYWLWKPYIILDTLKNIPENDIIIYADTGIKITNSFDNILSNLDQYDMLIFPLTPIIHANKRWTKDDLFKIMNIDTSEARNSTQMNASLIVMRNNTKTRDFIKKWLEWCENEHALTDSISANESPDFIDHRHDQSILSLLMLQEKELDILALPFNQKDYYNHHRRRDIKKTLRRK